EADLGQEGERRAIRGRGPGETSRAIRQAADLGHAPVDRLSADEPDHVALLAVLLHVVRETVQTESLLRKARPSWMSAPVNLVELFLSCVAAPILFGHESRQLDELVAAQDLRSELRVNRGPVLGHGRPDQAVRVQVTGGRHIAEEMPSRDENDASMTVRGQTGEGHCGPLEA